MKTRVFPLLAACLLLSSWSVDAADWLQFRGPSGLGIAADKNLPQTWSDDENTIWKTELPGPGSSCPIVVGNKIFLTCYSGYGADRKNAGDIKDLKRHLLCLGRVAGKSLGTRDVPALQPEHAFQGFTALHGYASATPVSDG